MNRHVASYHNNIVIIATHFKRLTELQQETQEFDNYAVEVIDVDGTKRYTYKLLPGVSFENVALDIVQKEGFPATMIEETQRLMNQQER